MESHLLIVESPAKAKTIEKFLGKDFKVKSSFGHIRDLAKKNLGIHMENGFVPEYEIDSSKTALVSELKTLAKKAHTVWLASDEDREGEAIAWHLQESLGLKPENTKRIVFHEITKEAILHAVETPRSVNMNMVNAQQARRVLDRLVGFEISPILWKKLKPKLSAGRVQSVAVRLVVEREREIMAHTSHSQYRVEGVFLPNGKKADKIKAEIETRFADEKAATKVLEQCIGAAFQLSAIEKKAGVRSPAPPFTTSTLQQEASRKLGYSVSQTMSIAQRLYEAGLITYMRTDSTLLSQLAINAAKQCIEALYGPQYAKSRQYATKSKSAQEAHEAIRPTYLNNSHIEGSPQERRLYDLIWKRTIASQMADAQIEKTTLTIESPQLEHPFIATGEVILFDGFIKVYHESKDDDTTQEEGDARLPQLAQGDALSAVQIFALQRFNQRPPRYAEASLVKKLEELGIGRPSTYAPTISTIMQRGYVSKEDRQGVKRDYIRLELQNGEIKKELLSETTGAEKAKLFPSDVGMLVNDFLQNNFDEIVDYGFTAKVEEDFDRIADGKLDWQQMLADFYKPFHLRVENTLENARPTNAERVLGKDPKTGKDLIVRIGRFGPIAQIGNGDDGQKQFASLKSGQLIESITLEEALQLFQLPRHLGTHLGKDVSTSIGRFGPYIKFGSAFISLPKTEDPYHVQLERAVEIIAEAEQKAKEKHILSFDNEGIQVLNGRFGPYICQAGKNYKIPRGTEPKSLTLEDCLAIIQATPSAPAKTAGAAKKPATSNRTAAAGKSAAIKKAIVAKKSTTTKKATASPKATKK
jgi:DNA topoisomerase I, bacterial